MAAFFERIETLNHKVNAIVTLGRDLRLSSTARQGRVRLALKSLSG